MLLDYTASELNELAENLAGLLIEGRKHYVITQLQKLNSLQAIVCFGSIEAIIKSSTLTYAQQNKRLEDFKLLIIEHLNDKE